MNELSLTSFLQTGLWCVIQVTLLALAAMIVLWPLSWLKRPMGSGPALSAISMAAVLTLLCFLPMPTWWNALALNTESLPGSTEIVSSAGQPTLPRTPVGPAKTELHQSVYEKATINWRAVLENATITASDAESNAGPSHRFNSWGNALLAFAAISLGAGLISLAASLAGLVRLRRASTEIANRELAEQMDVLLALASCRKRVAVRECALVNGPATFGHWSPVILLPPTWRNWSASQLSAVLAHEVAHICRGDFLSHLLSQCCLALHFYHPLMHWLVGRLRLDQELAADALASSWSGPRESYLRALAEVALSLPPRSSGLAVRSFVPSRGAWVRRIEMLKSMQGSGRAAGGWPLVWLGLMGLVAIAISTVRSPDRRLFAQESGGAKPTPSANQSADEYLVKYAPSSAEMIVAIRPNEIINHPLGKLLGEMGGNGGILASASKMGMDPSKYEQIVVSGPLTLWDRPQPQGVFIARYSEPNKLQTLLPKEKSMGEVEGVALFMIDQGMVWGSLDTKTVILGSTVEVTKSLTGKRGSTLTTRKAWSNVKSSPFAVIVKSEAIRAIAKDEPQTGSGSPQAIFRRNLKAMALGSPLWEDTDAIALQLDLKDDLKATLHTESNGEEGAKEVVSTISALSTLARNWLRTELDSNKQLAPVQVILAELARDTLSKMKSEAAGASTHTTVVLADKGKVASLLPSLISSARAEAAQVNSLNNLKQIALALHNYHSAYEYFPPAVLYGPDGKTPHSWRVAILPYIEQDALNRQYKLDEPWDSENNKKVLAQIPSIFQDPSERGKSTNTSYFAVAGANTILNSTPKGTKIFEITDGTSNTAMVVDAKKEIPWTKPEDVGVDTPAAMLGNQPDAFFAALGDGSVRVIKKSIDPGMLKWLFTRDDGNNVTIP